MNLIKLNLLVFIIKESQMKSTVKPVKNDIFHNIWFKRALSILSIVYAIYICLISYRSIFYDVIITNPVMFCIYLSIISAAAVTVMIFTRHQILTKIASFIVLPALLPIVIMCLGSWEMIVPLALAAIIVFFASGATEGTKTLLGTVYVLIYILTILAYFIFTTYLSSPAIKETVETGVSPSELYRYEVIATTDSSNGSTTVLLEPNDKDIIKNSVTYKIKGYNRTLCVKRPLTDLKLEWREDELYINGERWFTPEQAQDIEWFEQGLLATITG